MRDPHKWQPISRGVRISEWPVVTRPRERLLAGRPVSDVELIAVLLGSGTRSRSALALAEHALVSLGGPAGLARADGAALRAAGCGPASAARLVAAIELGRRCLAASALGLPCDSPAAAAAALAPHLSNRERETLAVALLARKRRLISVVPVYAGTVSGTTVRVGELFTEAVRRNASAILLAHNHPSGDPLPSPDDLRTTTDAVAAGRLLGIPVIDHLVFGAGRWHSLRERSGISFDE